MSLVIKMGKCEVHTDCPNGFYLESAICSTCKVSIETDLEFSLTDLPIQFGCPNCQDMSSVTLRDVDNFFRLKVLGVI